MNIFNRLLAILFFLLVAALAIGAVGIATGLITVDNVDRVHMYAPLHHALSDFHTSHPANTEVWKVAVDLLGHGSSPPLLSLWSSSME